MARRLKVSVSRSELPCSPSSFQPQKKYIFQKSKLSKPSNPSKSPKSKDKKLSRKIGRVMFPPPHLLPIVGGQSVDNQLPSLDVSSSVQEAPAQSTSQGVRHFLFAFSVTVLNATLTKCV
jgi:hypothetical protein